MSITEGLLNSNVWVRQYQGIDPMTNADLLTDPAKMTACISYRVRMVRNAQGQEVVSNIKVITVEPIATGDYVSLTEDLVDDTTYRAIEAGPKYDIDGTVDHYEARL